MEPEKLNLVCETFRRDIESERYDGGSILIALAGKCHERLNLLFYNKIVNREVEICR